VIAELCAPPRAGSWDSFVSGNLDTNQQAQVFPNHLVAWWSGVVCGVVESKQRVWELTQQQNTI
jgi:hypothetical protein